MRRTSLAALALALVGSARAAEPSAEIASRNELTLRVQGYEPAIDAEFARGAGPYGRAFGSSDAWGGRLEYARTWPTIAGSIGLGAGLGYLGAYGHGRYRDTTTGELVESGDATALHVVPLSLFVAWRLDAVGRWRLPLAPYARVALERFAWIATGTEHETRYGATDGWSATFGAALFLDVLDPTSARDLARETGIRHTALTIDLTRSRVDDFGSAHSWDLSSAGWTLSAGLLLGF